MKRRDFLLSLTALGVACRTLPDQSDRENSQLAALIDPLIERELKERSLPGLSLAVMRGAEVVLAKGYGLADVAQKIPARPETNYPIGSISKQFTAAAIMRLVEQGRLQLDEPFTKYLPDYSPPDQPVLLRYLLQQTSGIREFFTIPGYDELEAGPPERYSRADLIRLFEREPLQFAPGERWAYSNSNYTLLGLIIEQVSGRSYAQYLRETFFQSLKLNSTQACDHQPPSEAHARGYLLENNAFVSAPPVNMNTAIGDGGLCSSVLDLVEWQRALVHGQAVSPSYYERMITPEPVRRGYTPAYGYGLSLVTLDGRRRIAHNGEIGGYCGTLAYYPAADLTIAVLTNRGRLWPEAIEKGMARATLGLPPLTVKDLPLSRAERARYVGTYHFGVFPIKIIDEADRLKYDMLGFRPKYTLLPQGNHQFVAQDEPDAIRLSFTLANDRAEQIVIEMAGMHWYADRLG